MWLFIMLSLAILSLLALIYLLTRVHRFSPFQALAKKHRALSWLAALLPLAAPGLFALINVTTLIVVLLHLMAAFLLCSLVAFLISRLARREIPYDLQGAVAVCITVLWLGVGWYMAHHVFQTEYRLETRKPLRHDFRIVLIADSHLGITLDGEDFAAELGRVRALEPDAVVLVGDFVDDDSEAADMIAACSALGELADTCGVYFVYGNHDEGYYSFRDFNSRQLRAELENNGVTILEDEAVLLDDSVWLVGRRDRSSRGRADIRTLLAELDPEKYSIVLDHQPNDYEAEAEAGADLVLSGHTHGGHIFPAGQIGLLMGANDAIYGLERRGDTDFIVTSGISGWAIPFKTMTFSEFAVIDITAIQ